MSKRRNTNGGEHAPHSEKKDRGGKICTLKMDAPACWERVRSGQCEYSHCKGYFKGKNQ